MKPMSPNKPLKSRKIPPPPSLVPGGSWSNWKIQRGMYGLTLAVEKMKSLKKGQEGT
jgi:hypothetical protein